MKLLNNTLIEGLPVIDYGKINFSDAEIKIMDGYIEGGLNVK